MPSQGQSPTFDPFDPFRPFVAEDGLEYEDLASYLCSKPVDCARNKKIRANSAVIAKNPITWSAWVTGAYYYQNRAGDSYAAGPNFVNIRRPQLWDRHAPGFPDHVQSQPGQARDGGADPGTPTSAALREAGEPEVLGRVGA